MIVLHNENNFKGYGGLIVILTRTRTASAVCTREITGVDGANKNRQMMVLLPRQGLYSDVFGSIEGGRTD